VRRTGRPTAACKTCSIFEFDNQGRSGFHHPGGARRSSAPATPGSLASREAQRSSRAWNPGRGQPGRRTSAPRACAGPHAITAEMVSAAVLRPERMSTIDLFQYVRHLDRQRAVRPDATRSSSGRKVFYPLSCLVMVVLALPFAYLHFRSRRHCRPMCLAACMAGISFVLLEQRAWPPGQHCKNWAAVAHGGLAGPDLLRCCRSAAFGLAGAATMILYHEPLIPTHSPRLPCARRGAVCPRLARPAVARTDRGRGRRVAPHAPPAHRCVCAYLELSTPDLASCVGALLALGVTPHHRRAHVSRHGPARARGPAQADGRAAPAATRRWQFAVRPAVGEDPRDDCNCWRGWPRRRAAIDSMLHNECHS